MNTDPTISSSTEIIGQSLNRYAPVPANGKLCAVSGFGHARFYQKVINGPGRQHVRLVDLRESGESRGTKFYHVGDMLAWMNSLADQQRKESATA